MTMLSSTGQTLSYNPHPKQSPQGGVPYSMRSVFVRICTKE